MGKRGSVFRQTCAGTQPAPPMPDVKHCWVNSHAGRVPGLLTRWIRTVDGTWMGLVIFPVLGDDGAWRIMETEVEADQLERA